MPRYKDVENIRKLFDNEYKKTRDLIAEGETHLDNLAEGFSEATRVLDMLPTADVVPRSEVIDEFADRLKEKLFTIPTVYNAHFRKMIDAVMAEMKGGE